ncbi:type IV secretion protein Rhs [Nocardiopsis sp. RSe5-2]|uniref:Type IV secretion protein Rhs n=1 Tax=Nocardiopsis endophytica TaxID=3018445 RepID=A0ABT4U3W3_9ACTN|nr:RHS repeat-associated core domain-containing protein [Nocardiopsis endophytica]MDA2811651.1 type IV secretion protein Rhs [Nocardiopsis endophytica]
MVLVAGSLFSVPASALMFNDRPGVEDDRSIDGRAAVQEAIAEDDTVDKAAVTGLDAAEWPEPESVAIALDGQQEMRSFSAPADGEQQDEGEGKAVSLGPVEATETEEWESPLKGAGAEKEADRVSERRLPSEPQEPESSASSGPPPSPDPSTSPSPDGEGQEGTPAPEQGQDGQEESTEQERPEEEPAEEEPEEARAPEHLEEAALEVLSRDQADSLGVDGLLLRLKRTDGGSEHAPVRVEVDYSDFATAFGGDYGSRLELIALDACGEGADPDCVAAVDLDSENDTEAQTLSAIAPATAGEGTLLAATADTTSKGGDGDYAATKLQASSKWNVGPQTGGFSWSYPIGTPPVASGLTPDIALGYSSQSVDGRTASSNNQTSWVGEGFDYHPGSIERRYKLCQDDGHEVADQCWERENATLSLNGMSSELIIDSDGEWHLKNDDGSRIEKLTGAKNGDDDGEYWKLTTPDGTKYFFGRNRLPGYTSGDEETEAAWTQPVYGDDPGEPCHESSFEDSWCQQAYKWNLDYVEDAHGNAMAFYYNAEGNHYGRNLESTATPYDRGGYLERIEYGLRSDDVYGTAPAKVEFGVSERCLPTDSFSCEAGDRTEDNADHWPDVPIDRECGDGEDCTGNHSPAFFSTKKLDSITTKAHGGEGYATIDSFELEHKYPEPGDGTDPALWLDSITHTGHTGSGDPQAYPSVTFGGTPMVNRVDSTSDGLAEMYKWRVTAVYTETGGQVDVSYSQPECEAGQTPKPHENTKRCYPVIWTPEGEEELTDWFHKYTVTQVAEIDLVGDQPDVITSYDYEGGAAWAHATPDGITPEENQTWSVFRGYETVKVRTGHPEASQSEEEHLFYRGMDGDELPDGGTRSVTITDSEGNEVADDEQFNGQTREVLTRNGPDGPVVSKTISEPWKKKTAERDYSWGTLQAHIIKTKSSETYTALGKDGADGWRTTRTTNTFDDRGYVVQTHDEGDTGDPGDDRCTLTTYNRNTDAWIMETVSRVQTLDVACADTDTADKPGDVISDVRTHFDGKAYGEAPTRGLPTSSERVDDYADGKPQYQVTGETTYDSYGRPLTVTDALGNVTTTEHTSSVAGGTPTSTTVTNALGHTKETEHDLRGNPVAETDANGNRADLTYDAFGRLTQVWLPDRPKANNPRPSMAFAYHVAKDAPAQVVTKTLNADAEYITSYEIYDGLLRKRQTQSPATGGGRRITDVFHDSRGNTVIERDTYFNEQDPSGDLFIVNNHDEIPRQTETKVDGAGRVTASVHVSRGEERWRTSTAYLGDRTLVTEPEGGTGTTTITDARGRTAEKRTHHGREPVGEYDATTYTYAKNDEIASITDPGGNTWEYTYDLAGRKVEEVDPDTGRTTFTYDAADRLVTTTDARGRTLYTGYDALGRETERRDDGPDGALRAEWTYDTVAKGQQTSATRYIEGNAYTTKILGYDRMNRVRARDITIPGTEEGLAGTYRYLYAYNPDGSLRSTRMPEVGGLSMEVVQTGYDDIGQADTLSGSSSIVQEALYSKTGDLLQRAFDRGTSGSESSWVTRVYDEATDRLTKASMVHEVGAGSLTTQFYDYNDAGNILSIRDEPTDEERPSDVQCFQYDHLQRLTEAWTPNATGETACAQTPSTDTLGGAAPYWDSYTYDESGNRVSETKRTPGGTTDRAYTGTAETGGPGHGVTRVDQSGHNGESVSTYEYDEAGNMVRRDSEDGDQQLTWDAEGNLASVTGGAAETDYVYDADGERLIRRQGPEWTLYLPGQEVAWTSGGDGTEATRYYEHAGETVAVRDGEGMHWLFSDHNGSSQLAVDARTGETVQRRFSPFGELRSSSASWPSGKGYVGGTIDEATGLTQLGARAYDAAIGRFISVDPLMKPDDSQQMHGYAYADNSPVASSDASGLLKMGPGGCGCTSSPPQGLNDFTRIKQEAMWTRQGRNVSRMRQGSGVYQRPYYQNSRSSFYTGARGSAPAPTYIDPYDNDSYKEDPTTSALDKAKSWAAERWGTWDSDQGFMENLKGMNWVNILGDAALVGGLLCAVCAGVAAGVSVGLGAYKIINGNAKDGIWDLAGSLPFGIGRASKLVTRGKIRGAAKEYFDYKSIKKKKGSKAVRDRFGSLQSRIGGLRGQDYVIQDTTNLVGDVHAGVSAARTVQDPSWGW